MAVAQLLCVSILPFVSRCFSACSTARPASEEHTHHLKTKFGISSGMYECNRLYHVALFCGVLLLLLLMLLLYTPKQTLTVTQAHGNLNCEKNVQAENEAGAMSSLWESPPYFAANSTGTSAPLPVRG